VTLSWVTLQGHFTELLKSQTKWSAAGEWSQYASVSSNSDVFKRLREERSDGASLTASGRLFQARAAATGNARSPSVERLVDLTTRVGSRSAGSNINMLRHNYTRRLQANNRITTQQLREMDYNIINNRLLRLFILHASASVGP